MKTNYLIPSELTKDNYYSALGRLQNTDECINQDIITFTAFLSWEEKVVHYAHYYARVNGIGE